MKYLFYDLWRLPSFLSCHDCCYHHCSEYTKIRTAGDIPSCNNVFFCVATASPAEQSSELSRLGRSHSLNVSYSTATAFRRCGSLRVRGCLTIIWCFTRQRLCANLKTEIHYMNLQRCSAISLLLSQWMVLKEKQNGEWSQEEQILAKVNTKEENLSH